MMASKDLEYELLDPLLEIAKWLSNAANGEAPEDMQGHRGLRRYAATKVSAAHSDRAR